MGSRIRRQTINKINRVEGSVYDNFVQNYYVNGWNGNDNNTGKSWDSPFLTMAQALSVASSGATINLTGRITESITAPLGLFDITINGVTAGTPRQSTASGVQAGYSAYWLYSSNSTVANLTLREQGWKFKNICFQAPTSTATTAAAVLMVRAETATYPDPSHVVFEDCYFAGGGNGIIDSGGVGFVTIKNCRFYGHTGFSIQNIAGAGIAAPLMWHIVGNRFLGMANGIYSAFSHGVIENNVFSDGGTPNTTVVLNTAASGGGGNNFVINNHFQTATANFDTPDVVGNATDVWRNFSIDGSDLSSASTGVELGQPA